MDGNQRSEGKRGFSWLSGESLEEEQQRQLSANSWAHRNVFPLSLCATGVSVLKTVPNNIGIDRIGSNL